MTIGIPEDVLDDAVAVAAADPGGMLREVAAAPAQLREAAFRAAEVDLSRLDVDTRPRAVVVAGMGGSGVAGDILAAVAGPGVPVSISTHRGYGLPGWIGPADVVVAVSYSGATEETLSAAEEATRRGCRVVGVGAADSPLAERVAAAHGPYFTAPPGRLPRAAMWSLVAPLLVVADALNAASIPPEALTAAADVLDVVTTRCTVTKDVFVNPAKDLAVALAGRLPVVWGTSELAHVAAYRLACQCNENAKSPATWGSLPETGHNQIVGLDAVTAADLQSIVLLRDVEEHPQVTTRVEGVRDIARQRGIPVHELVAEPGSRLDRLAMLVALGDFTSVYLAIATGFDPSTMAPIDQLKARLRA